MKTCKICNKKTKQHLHLIFYPTEEGRNLFGGYLMRVCLECKLNYLSQYCEFLKKDIVDYLNWLG